MVDPSILPFVHSDPYFYESEQAYKDAVNDKICAALFEIRPLNQRINAYDDFLTQFFGETMDLFDFLCDYIPEGEVDVLKQGDFIWKSSSTLDTSTIGSLFNIYVFAIKKLQDLGIYSPAHMYLSDLGYETAQDRFIKKVLLGFYTGDWRRNGMSFAFNFTNDFLTNPAVDEGFLYNTDINNKSYIFKRQNNLNDVFRLKKKLFSTKFDNCDDSSSDYYSDFFSGCFSSQDGLFDTKLIPEAERLLIKQKRYKRRKVIYPRVKIEISKVNGVDNTVLKYSDALSYNNNYITTPIYDQNLQHEVYKKNRSRLELAAIALEKRMLRTKRTLVLPAHTGMTVVTSSYDVIHS
jgi:hypothetical protein